jgi:predicted RNase H-like HicB family nuclease
LSVAKATTLCHTKKSRFETLFGEQWKMKPEDRYLKFVRWEDQDGYYVGYCPDLFPWGGVCHGASEEETFRALCQLVSEEVADLVAAGSDLPPSATRAMRDAVPA